MTAMLEIDGTTGEGGGQILRTSLALSALTGLPFRLVDIRKKRSRDGLMRQHLTCVNAAAAVCGARTKGAELRSTTLEFVPGAIEAGDYEFAIGTAGSTTLVFQTVLPALASADGPSTVRVSGGTHNQMAPTVEFIKDTFLPQLAKVGPTVDLDVPKFGFYPAGGGQIEARIQPAAWTGFELVERGEIVRRSAEALVAHLPEHVAERELDTVMEQLSWKLEQGSIVYADDLAPGPGNVLTIQLESEALTETFVGFGEKGVPAERVASRTCDEVKRYLVSGAPVGEHLADQLVLLFAIAGSGRFRCSAPSQHTLTQLEIIPKFLEVDIECERIEEKVWEIQVSS